MNKVVRGVDSTYRISDDAISKGGVGSIHRTDDPGFVYKQYFDPDKAPRRDHLEKLVVVGRDVLLRQGKQPGDTPESSVNWPIDIVPATSGSVRGVVLPIIPSTLFNANHGNVRTLDFLVMARAKPPQAEGRVALLMRMAEILEFIHTRGLIHGDVNGKNLAWAVNPMPIMYLIDCDGMVPQSPRPESGVQAMGWADPRVLDRQIPAHDQFSDWYALALAMYRGLLLTPGKLDKKTTDGRWSEPGKIPAAFPAPLATLLRRGLSALDGGVRPAPKEWVDALVSTYLPGGKFARGALEELDELSGTTKPAQQSPNSAFHPIPPLSLQHQTPSPPLPVRPLPAESGLTPRYGKQSEPADGEWYCEEHRFGLRISVLDGYGYCTISNAPAVFQYGDIVLVVDHATKTTIMGRHLFVDGSWWRVQGELRGDNRMAWEGRYQTWMTVRV